MDKSIRLFCDGGKEQMEVERRKFGNSGKKITAHISLKHESLKDNQWDNKRKSDKIVSTKPIFPTFSGTYFILCLYLLYTFTH